MKKLKQQYLHPERDPGCGRTWTYYPFMRNFIFKAFSTRQEKSYYWLHLAEYGDYPLKLRAARGKMLANAWDDYKSCVLKVKKSWKHNSRRKHQHYR